jgi:hypothetical protein
LTIALASSSLQEEGYKARGWGTLFPKMPGSTWVPPHHRPLILAMPSPMDIITHTIKKIKKLKNKFSLEVNIILFIILFLFIY